MAKSSAQKHPRRTDAHHMEWSYLKGAWRTAHFALTCSYANTTSSFLLSIWGVLNYVDIYNTKMGDVKNNMKFFFFLSQTKQSLFCIYLYVYILLCWVYIWAANMGENNSQAALGINCIYYYKQIFKLLQIKCWGTISQKVLIFSCGSDFSEEMTFLCIFLYLYIYCKFSEQHVYFSVTRQ